MSEEELLNYYRVHKWMLYNYGSATKCEDKNCNKISKSFQWAKINGKKYEKDLQNYRQLCRSCHAKYDISEESLRLMRVNSKNGNKQVCPNGHKYTKGNTYIYLSIKTNNTNRICKICAVKRTRLWRLKNHKRDN